MIGLLEDPRIARIDILAIQEPWRNPFNGEGYNPRNSPFYFIEETSERIRAAIYVNKRIPRSRISEIHKEKDLISLKMSTIKEDIYIHNVYIKPITHSIRDISSILYRLKGLLENKGGHIILGDFNLHHLIWNSPLYDKYYYIADEFLDIISDIGATLHTPQGLATRDCQRGTHHERTTIDLIFSNLENIEPSTPRIQYDLK
jgi:SepF-like predicted cell division protein (DUF552 family)